ncbi:MAG: ABC transporter ATP-binding protein [Planctomycetes bacterium]|nr:ABC transporter ATP-binding protein [Planctomycetota bacterium]
MAGTPVLETRGLKRHFKVGAERVEVLRGVNFSMAAGEFAAILGSSGAGKSTLMHILGLLDRPDSGEVLWNGESVSQASEARRTVLRATESAFVFQFYFLLPEFSALENVMMPAAIARGRGRAPASAAERRARAEDLLTRVGLKERMRHRPQQLSGGERQRVAIARGLMNRPSILFCDEPTGNLDSRTAQSIHELLVSVNRELQQTILVVTHEVDMAAVADRRVVMRDGLIGTEL